MRRPHQVYRDGWASAMEPAFVSAPNRVDHVSKREKQREAEAMRAEVNAHIARGGSYQRLPTTPLCSKAA